MLKKVITIAFAATLAGCAPGETPGRLNAGQWSPVRSIGQSAYLIEGWDTEDAIAGGTTYCSKLGKRFEAVNIVPHTQRERATITFKCDWIYSHRSKEYWWRVLQSHTQPNPAFNPDSAKARSRL